MSIEKMDQKSDLELRNFLDEFNGDYELVSFDKNDFVYDQFHPATHIYIIQSGRVKTGKVIDFEKVILWSVFTDGDIFGEQALLENETRCGFAMALDNKTQLIRIPKLELLKQMHVNDDLNEMIMSVMGRAIRKCENRAEAYLYKNARNRVINYLIDLAKEKGKRVGFEVVIPFHLKHQDMASLTDVSRQTISLLLNDLKESNIISFDRRRMLIRDLDKLTLFGNEHFKLDFAGSNSWK